MRSACRITGADSCSYVVRVAVRIKISYIKRRICKANAQLITRFQSNLCKLIRKIFQRIHGYFRSLNFVSIGILFVHDEVHGFAFTVQSHIGTLGSVRCVVKVKIGRRGLSDNEFVSYTVGIGDRNAADLDVGTVFNRDLIISGLSYFNN